MRGRAIWSEPPGSSMCAFCAHRFATRRPSQMQRRFLQSSKPASKPPAAAAALREDNEWPVESHPQSGSQPSGTPVGAFRRRPAFGNANLSASGSSDGMVRPSFGSGGVELTAEERQARDLISESEVPKPRRLVDVYPQTKPGSNRAGRPTPTSFSSKIQPKLSISRVFRGSERSILRSSPITPGTRDDVPLPEVRNLYERVAKRTEEIVPEISPGKSLPYDNVGRWGQLRRRGTSQEGQSRPDFGDPFAEGRTRREEESRLARYTPLVRIVASDGPRVSRYFKFENPETPSKVVRAVNSTKREDSPTAIESDLKTRPLVGKFPQGGENISRERETGDEALTAASSGATENWQPQGMRSTRYQTDASELLIRQNDETGGKDGQIWRAVKHAAEDADRPKRVEESPRSQDGEIEREDRQRRRVEKYAAEAANKSKKEQEFPPSHMRDKTRRRNQFLEEDENQEQQAISKAELRRERKREKAAKKAAMQTPVLLPEYISVANLAAVLRVRVEDFIEKMEELGFEETNYDYILNGEDAGLIAMEYNFEPIIDRGISEDLQPCPSPEDPSSLPPRPPVVTIMGHVDHGKTTLLDWLRKSSVAATEHGGITQHIGAFSVPMPSGKIITFLDTPGHAAFLNMRQRGANVTDIVVLVVAADDSVKPQTIEAINHAKAAKVPMIVAINKVDKEESQVDRVKQDLARHGVEIEDFGGETQVVCVSGKTGQGMEELEDAVVTLSEILDMRAEQDGQAEGWVLEASIKSMGKVATVLVRRGTVRVGDFIVAGNTWARIRCLRNEAGVDVTEAGPGTPVEIDGWKEQPEAGDEVLQAPTESKAKSVVENRLEKKERDKMAEDMKAINEARKFEQEKRVQERVGAEAERTGIGADDTLASLVVEGAHGPKQIQFIVKGDVSGSVEAIIDYISSIGNGEVQVHILRSGVGQLSEFDVEHAAVAKGYLINFNNPIDPAIAREAQAAKVKIIDHNIIYRLVDEVKATMSEHLPPLVTQKVLGEAEISQIFEVSTKGRRHKSVAGCKIKNGIVPKNAKVRVLRCGQKIFDGSLESLKNVKKDVMEMRKGSECGMGFDGWGDFHVGDQIQSYETKEEKRYL